MCIVARWLAEPPDSWLCTVAGWLASSLDTVAFAPLPTTLPHHPIQLPLHHCQAAGYIARQSWHCTVASRLASSIDSWLYTVAKPCYSCLSHEDEESSALGKPTHLGQSASHTTSQRLNSSICDSYVLHINKVFCASHLQDQTCSRMSALNNNHK